MALGLRVQIPAYAGMTCGLRVQIPAYAGMTCGLRVQIPAYAGMTCGLRVQIPAYAGMTGCVGRDGWVCWRGSGRANRRSQIVLSWKQHDPRVHPDSRAMPAVAVRSAGRREERQAGR